MTRDRLALLRVELEAAGLKPGTPEFEKTERSRKVELCKQLKNVDSCWNCEYFDYCELIKAHLRDIYKVKKSAP
jgi:hypothetical protein